MIMVQFDLINWANETIGIGPGAFVRTLLSIVLLMALWLARRMLLRSVERKVSTLHSRYRWRKTTTYIASAVAIFTLGRLWLHGFTSLSTMLGLISAGVAIALKDPLVNLVGWMFIMWRQPFGVGDRIQVGNSVAGDVIDQRVFAFTLMEIGNWVDADQSTGRVIHVPNGRVFTETVANYSRGFKYIWDELSVTITFESSWRKAKGLLNGIVTRQAEHLSDEAEKRLREASRTFMIFYTKLTPIVYTSVEDSGVKLTLRYLTEPQKRRGRKQAIWEDILEAFAACDDIDFAYPTQRMYMNAREGKPGTRASELSPSLVSAPSGADDGRDPFID